MKIDVLDGLILGVYAVLFFFSPSSGYAKPGDADEPIRYRGQQTVDYSCQDGGLPPIVGVHNYQVLRANRTRPELGDGLGWTYHHAPTMAYWHGKFYLQCKANMIDEDVSAGQMLFFTSTDGQHWSLPQLSFPLYEKGGHQNVSLREAFYLASNDRLLAVSCYGEGGALCSREIRRDDTLGPIYTMFADTLPDIHYFKTSTDAGYVAACEAMLKDNLKMPFWWEQLRDKQLYDFKFPLLTQAEINALGIQYRKPSMKNIGKGATIYHRKDGAAVILWKFGLSALSFDDGQTWSKPVKLSTITTRMQMAFCQRTDDGRYALIYDPDPGTMLGERRYPMVAITGDDGISFDDMAVIHGEVPNQRYVGSHKEIGVSYVHGFQEGQGNPPGDDMWVTYSGNKEDIWVTRIQVPFRTTVTEPISDDFDSGTPEQAAAAWNLYSPLWAPVAVVPDYPGAAKRCLELKDRDPNDYARACRVFPECERLKLQFKLYANQNSTGTLQLDLMNREGKRPVRLLYQPDGALYADLGSRQQKLLTYYAHDWTSLTLEVNAKKQVWQLKWRNYAGDGASDALPFAEPTKSVTRLVFRTGDWRRLGSEATKQHGDLLGCDEPVKEVIYRIDELHTFAPASDEK